MSPLHDCAWAEAVLTGESPEPTGSRTAFEDGVRACPSCSALAEALSDLDALAGSLPELAVPKDLSQHTLQQVLAEIDGPRAQPVKSRRTGSLVLLMGGLAVAAASLLAILPQGPSPAPPERLVARGNATALPSVSLKVAVDEGHGLTRHHRGKRYPAGTRVQFRVGLDQPAEVALLRVDAASVQVVTRSALDGGDHDLELDGTPLAWEVEPGESDAHFVVVAGPAESLSKDSLDKLVPTAASADPPTICAHITHLACDERLLEVSP